MVRALVGGLLILSMVGCGAREEAAPSSCDGVDATLGGCDPDRPTFSADTCAEVGEQFGQQLSERALKVFDGPQTVDGNDRTAQLTHAVVLHVQLANKHLRERGMAVDCDVPEFVEAAVAAFSAEFKERVGANAFSGRIVSFEEWLVDLERFLVVIDEDEEEPYLGSAEATPSPLLSRAPTPSATTAVEPTERPPVIVPAMIAARPSLPWCGHEVVRREAQGDLRDAAIRRCWLDAFEAGEQAEFVSDAITIEGGRVREFSRALGDGVIEVITDWTADPLSSREWTTMRCRGIRAVEIDSAGAEVFVADECTSEDALTADADTWPSAEERQMLDDLVRFAQTNDPDSFARLPFAEEVQLGLADQLMATRAAADLAQPDAWRLEAAAFRGRVGPFSVLDPLADWDRAPPGTVVRELQASVGPHPHCASPAVPAPRDLADLRRIGLQPVGQPCLAWWTVDVFLTPEGTIAAITLDSYEP